MKEHSTRHHIRGAMLLEAMVSGACMSVILGGLLTSAVHLTKTLAAIDNYQAVKLHIVDYIALDMRRSKDYAFKVDGSKLTLPLDLNLPQFYAADGRTLLPVRRTAVDEANEKPKKKHHLSKSRYYVHYGDLERSVPVRYYLWENVLYRKEGTRPAREIARGISEITFTPASLLPGQTATPAEMLSRIESSPEVGVQVTFESSRYWRRVPMRLTNSTFLRNFYFSPL